MKKVTYSINIVVVVAITLSLKTCHDIVIQKETLEDEI